MKQYNDEDDEQNELTPEERAEREALEAAYQQHREDYERSHARARQAWAKFAHARRNGEPAEIHFEMFKEYRDSIPKGLIDPCMEVR